MINNNRDSSSKLVRQHLHIIAGKLDMNYYVTCMFVECLIYMYDVIIGNKLCKKKVRLCFLILKVLEIIFNNDRSHF